MASAIERDLIRWQRGRWLAVIVFVLALQIGAIVLASRKTEPRRSLYPQEPKIAMSERAGDSEWTALDNPFLFASATWTGFSGDAWLRKPEWQPPAPGRIIPMQFLAFAEAQPVSAFDAKDHSFRFLTRRKPGAVFAEPAEAPQPERQSEVRLEGFQGRTVVKSPPIPTQFHNDILSNTVVETMIGPDGLVISARVIENSGSPKADADALTLTRRTIFSPRPGSGRAPQVGKLIFAWFALDLSQTNSVRR